MILNYAKFAYKGEICLENSTPQEPVAQEQPAFAPSWDTSHAPATPTKSFEQAFEQSADRISNELELDTRKQDQPQAKQKQEAKDPLEEAELEIAPGKKLKRGEVAKKLSQFEELEKKHKNLESLSGTKLREAAQARKQAEAQLQQAQRALQIESELTKIIGTGDPDQVLRALGFDTEAYRQRAIEQAYRESQMSPEQREIERLRSYEQENARLRQDQETRQKQVQEYQAKQQKDQATNQAAQNLGKAFQQTAEHMKLPKTGLTIQRFANALSGANQRGLDPTMQELGEAVHQQYVGDVVSFLDELTPETFTKHIPSKTQQKLRQFFLQQTGAAAPIAQASGPPATRPKQKYTGVADYNQFIDQLTRRT